MAEIKIPGVTTGEIAEIRGHLTSMKSLKTCKRNSAACSAVKADVLVAAAAAVE